jgi:hypothetical protein
MKAMSINKAAANGGLSAQFEKQEHQKNLKMMKEKMKPSRPQSAKPTSFEHLLKISERKKNPNDPLGNPVYLHRRSSKGKSSLNSFAAQLILNEQ